MLVPHRPRAGLWATERVAPDPVVPVDPKTLSHASRSWCSLRVEILDCADALGAEPKVDAGQVGQGHLKQGPGSSGRPITVSPSGYWSPATTLVRLSPTNESIRYARIHCSGRIWEGRLSWQGSGVDGKAVGRSSILCAFHSSADFLPAPGVGKLIPVHAECQLRTGSG